MSVWSITANGLLSLLLLSGCASRGQVPTTQEYPLARASAPAADVAATKCDPREDYITFEQGSTRLTDRGGCAMVNAVRLLSGYFAQYPDSRIELVGHSDACASAAADMALSRRRARAVKAWLIQAGIKRGRIVRVYGMGHGTPLVAESRCDQPVNDWVEIRFR